MALRLQARTYRFEEFFYLDWFCHIAVKALSQDLILFPPHGRSRQREDRDGLVPLIRLDYPCGGYAVHARQVQVHQYNVGPFDCKGPDRVSSASCLYYLVPVHGKYLFYEHHVHMVVFDKENFLSASLHTAPYCHWIGPSFI